IIKGQGQNPVALQKCKMWVQNEQFRYPPAGYGHSGKKLTSLRQSHRHQSSHQDMLCLQPGIAYCLRPQYQSLGVISIVTDTTITGNKCNTIPSKINICCLFIVLIIYAVYQYMNIMKTSWHHCPFVC